MRKIALTWGVLAGIYGLFLGWHTSFQGPLTKTELDAYIARLSAEDLEGIVDARAFFENDDGKSFYMFNMMELRATAQYPDGRVATAQDANEAYGSAVLPLLIARGSYPVMVTDRVATFLNQMTDPAAGQFDQIALVRYRSRRDLLDMITSDDFNAAVVHKWAALERTIVAPTRLRIALSPAIVAPGLLIIIGALLTLFMLRTELNRRQTRAEMS